MKNKRNVSHFDASELEGSIDDAIAYLQRIKSTGGLTDFELVYEPAKDDVEYDVNFGHEGRFQVFARNKK